MALNYKSGQMAWKVVKIESITTLRIEHEGALETLAVTRGRTNTMIHEGNQHFQNSLLEEERKADAKVQELKIVLAEAEKGNLFDRLLNKLLGSALGL